MSIYKKLLEIQTSFKAHKSRFNEYGNFSYRTSEDIIEGLKPLLQERGLVLLINDKIEMLGDRYYVVATVELIDIETNEKITVSANAREPLQKKGQDENQLTGATSSYARKYALGGMFAIDDSKDSDSNMNQSDTIDSDKVRAIKDMIKLKGADTSKMLSYYNVSKIEDMNIQTYNHAMNFLNKKVK